MRQTNKVFFTNMIKELQQVQKETRGKIKAVRDKYDTGIITEKGCKEEIQKIRETCMNTHLNDLKTSVISRAGVEVDALTMEETRETRRRMKDIDYQQSLINTIQLLPFIADCSESELKERLSSFADDGVAIAALKKAASDNPNLSYEQRLRLAAALPTDSRGQRQATLEKLRDSVIRQIDEVYNGLSTPVEAKGFDSMLAYVDACNDECTVFSGFMEADNE